MCVDMSSHISWWVNSYTMLNLLDIECCRMCVFVEFCALCVCAPHMGVCMLVCMVLCMLKCISPTECVCMLICALLLCVLITKSASKILGH